MVLPQDEFEELLRNMRSTPATEEETRKVAETMDVLNKQFEKEAEQQAVSFERLHKPLTYIKEN